MLKTVVEFFDYLKAGTAPAAVVDNSIKMLEKAGFEKLDISKPWELNRGGRYYTRVYSSALFAFEIGEGFTPDAGFRMCAAHADHPCLHVKPKAEMGNGGYLKLDTDVYGGLILQSFMDRPLSIAGTVSIMSDDPFEPKVLPLDFKRPVCTIPSLAIHMNRDVNKGIEINKQTELIPIAALSKDDDEDFFMRAMADELGVLADDILDFDLYVYCCEAPCYAGLDEDFISSPRLDDLSSCYAIIKGLIEGSAKGLSIAGIYDNEEVGSRSKAGADSDITKIVLEKIYAGLSLEGTTLYESYFKSMILSLDVAHAYHPNYGGKSDPNLMPVCGRGPVIKLSGSQKYATDTRAVAIVQGICEKADIPYQKFVNRSDIAGGSTIGAIISSHIPVLTCDIGIGILAMHSARELMGRDDVKYLVRLCREFYS